jgi:hypothetical protein
MLPIEGSEILRIAVFSGATGFAVFCLSYGVYVWRKRNAGHRRRKPLPTRVAQVLALLGCAAIAVAWASNEFRGRAGIAGGSDVFVVTARGDTSAQQITSAETAAQGDVVVQFLTPADRARLAGIDLQRFQAQAKKEAIASKVLQSDEALLQEQAHLRSELLQLKGFAFQLQNSRYETERERASLTTAWTREESKLVEDIAAAASEYSAAIDRRGITQPALQRGQNLLKQGNVSRQELDSRVTNDISAELAVATSQKRMEALQERREALSARFGANIASLDKQIVEATRDHDGIAASLAELEARLAQVRRDLDADRDRAIASRQREVEAVDYDITILAAEKTRLTELGQVRAPFSGKIVYRHPAPGLASGNSPILVISAGTGFTASIRLPRAEVDELAAEREPVKLSLQSPVLHQFFTGRFVHAEPVPFEPERVVAYFDCTLPPEIIGQLGGSADPLRVRLLWHPALALQAGFKIGVLSMAASVLCFAAGIRNSPPAPRRRRSAAAETARLEASHPIRVSRDGAWHQMPPSPRDGRRTEGTLPEGNHPAEVNE